MKKLSLLLVLIIAGLHTAMAQLIWHPNLGTAPSGTVSLAWNQTRYVIATDGGDEFTSGDATEAMNDRLSELEIRWIRVCYIDNPATGCYEVTLELDPNTTGSERTVAFGTYASYVYIKQKSQNSYPTVEWPADRCYRICPGQPAEILLHDTEFDKSYFIWRTYEDDADEEMDYFLGTGGDYTYRLSSPGTYRFDFPNSDFSVRYYEAFSYIYDLSDEVFTASADGGAYRFYMDFYWDGPTRHWIDCTTDLSFLDAPLAAFNGGKVAGWDTHMRISHDYDEEQDRFYLLIVCPPNLGAKSISNHTHLLFDDDMAMDVYQPAGGSVRMLPVVYRYVASMSRVEAQIENSQPDVVYTLYRDGTAQSTVLGDGGTVVLRAPKAAGYYHVTASYAENGLSDEKELTGTRLVGDCMAALPEDRNWIFSQTHNSGGKYACDLTYYDGLGYAEQEVGIGSVSNGTADLVRPVVYDLHRREARKYLPYARTNGRGVYDSESVAHQEAFYRGRFNLGSATPYAYHFDEYEASPVGRLVQSRKPGREFQTAAHCVRNYYTANGASAVPRLDVDAASLSLTVNGFYDENTLSGVRTTDEDGAVSTVYTDREGHTVCEERLLRHADGTTESIVTRYVYDDCGRLAWVVTPEGVDRLTQGASYAVTSEQARNYCYVYRYDARGRLVEKRMPGREAEYLVYDRGDRLVMSQDGNMRAQKQWLLRRYDPFGRPVQERLAVDGSTAAQSQRHAAFCAAFDGGTAPAIYTGPSTLLREYAYDRYDCVSDPALAFADNALTRDGAVSLRDTSVRGLPTYEKLAVLTDGGIGGSHERAFYYDYRGREIQRVEKDAQGGVLRTTSRYDLIGNMLAQRESYTRGSKTDVLDRTFEYDSRSRMTKETAQFNGGEQAVVAYAYDELGQLTGKTYGTGQHAIHETMDYNMQGWLTEKSSELFDMQLRYYDPEPYYGGDAYYAGNISEWWWQHKNVNGNYDADNNTYIFHYDDLSRLNDSRLTYNESEDIADEFVERNISYDKNSNIITLNRSSVSSEDARSYRFSYNGNQRVKELNENVSYEYDANGNLREDALTNFVIYHNLFNLPSVIYTEGDCGLYYAYLADGTKVEVCGYDDNEPTRYAGSLVYNDTEFESASFGGGRIVGTNNGSEVHYFLTDHLGSTRVVAKVTPTGRIDLDRKDYYPFGREWKQPDMPTSDNRYTFSGKEKQHLRFQEVDYADFSARFYDPEGVIFIQQDPLQDDSPTLSAYTYCGNNPITIIDPDGRDSVYVFDRSMRPNDQGKKGETYTAEIFVEKNGTVTGPYRGSSYPNSKSNSDNSTKYNTVNEGEHKFNNKHGHHGGTEKGLNLVDQSGNRNTSGTNPNGDEVTMTNVNVHEGASDNGNYNSRGSQGCITIHPDDTDNFFSNFSWDAKKNSTKGSSNGSIFIYRKDSEDRRNTYKRITTK